MARKRKKLPDDFEDIIRSGSLEDFKAVFDTTEITATAKGKTTKNALGFRGLTPAHIRFLVDNGMDVNADCGWKMTAVAHQSYSRENLRCLVDNGADIDLCLDAHYGNALHLAARRHDPAAVKNLLHFGASVGCRFGWDSNTVLDDALAGCSNIDIVNMTEIARMLLDAGAEVTGKTKPLVRRIGETFEFYRDSFSEDLVDRCSDALNALYELFDVEPVPRRVMYDGKSPITVKSETWQAQYSELWDMLVPGSGNAGTVQGEAIRIVGKISYEILDNGAINWCDDHRKMTEALAEYFRMADGMDTELVEEACTLAGKVSANSDEELLDRLAELTVRWIVSNPEPVALGNVDYRR